MDICPFPHAQISTFLLKLRMHVSEINKPAPMKLARRDFCLNCVVVKITHFSNF
jgi:hypothetical protein